jgi:DNA primase
MSVWDDIKNKLSVEDVISDYTVLKSKGLNYTCLCPFHNEKSPSLIISPDKGIWHCFGCGLGGDIFKFVELIENLDKKEVLEKLAKKANYILPKLDKTQNPTHLNQSSLTPSQNSSKDNQNNSNQVSTSLSDGYKILDWASELYHQILLKTLQDPTNPVSLYCFKRGLTLDIIKKFKIGLAPSKPILTQYLNTNPTQLDLAYEVSLLKQIN